MIEIKSISNHTVPIKNVGIGNLFKYNEEIYMRVRMNTKEGIPCLKLDDGYVIHYLEPECSCILLAHNFYYSPILVNGKSELTPLDDIKVGEPFENDEGYVFVLIPLQTTCAYICLNNGGYYIDVEPYSYSTKVTKCKVTFQVDRK